MKKALVVLILTGMMFVFVACSSEPQIIERIVEVPVSPTNYSIHISGTDFGKKDLSPIQAINVYEIFNSLYDSTSSLIYSVSEKIIVKFMMGGQNPGVFDDGLKAYSYFTSDFSFNPSGGEGKKYNPETTWTDTTFTDVVSNAAFFCTVDIDKLLQNLIEAELCLNDFPLAEFLKQKENNGQYPVFLNEEVSLCGSGKVKLTLMGMNPDDNRLVIAYDLTTTNTDFFGGEKLSIEMLYYDDLSLFTSVKIDNESYDCSILNEMCFDFYLGERLSSISDKIGSTEKTQSE